LKKKPVKTSSVLAIKMLAKKQPWDDGEKGCEEGAKCPPRPNTKGDFPPNLFDEPKRHETGPLFMGFWRKLDNQFFLHMSHCLLVETVPCQSNPCFEPDG